MSDQDLDNLSEILRAAQLIRSFMKGIDAHAFSQDVMRRKAVGGQIILLAAAGKRISSTFKGKHSTIPWEHISNIGEAVLRSRDDRDPSYVYSFAKKSIPELILMISGLAQKGASRP